MRDHEQAILDLVRLGLKPDAASVRQYAGRLLRRQPASDGSDIPFREALARMILDDGALNRLARNTPREVSPTDTASGLALTTVSPPGDAPAPVLEPEAAQAIAGLIDERRRWEELALRGIEPTRTLLLTGSPGVGKTMTARYVASTLDLPLMSVDLSALMSSFLGKTGQNLRQALDYARAQPCVLLLDEFDAVAKRRDDPTDVGELKRIVNVLLLELERWPATSLLIAATNHPELLDRAVWRRFERVIAVGAPGDASREELVIRLASEFHIALTPGDLRLCVRATEGMSPADITAFVRDAARILVLGNSEAGEAGPILAELAMERLRRDGGERARRTYCGLARDIRRSTQREIASRLGVSHVTVGKLLHEWDALGSGIASERTEGAVRPRVSKRRKAEP